MKLSAIPFVRFALALLAGVLFEIKGGFNLPYITWLLGILLFLYAFACIGISDARKAGFKPWFGGSALVILFFFGIVLVQYKNPFQATSHIINYRTLIEGYSGIINSELEEKKSTIRCEVEVAKIKTNGQWKKSEGKVLVYFYKKDFPGKLRYGDVLLVSGTPQLINRPQNPGEFDLEKYYEFHGIKHRHFLNKDAYKMTGHTPGNPVIRLSLSIKEKVNGIFTKYIPADRERNIASALVLGIKNPLDSEILQAYSATGTMHVLAVSGLHVGIIYGLLLLFTSFIKKIKYGNIIQAGVLIILLWFYAVVTGLCPSVLRAVTMLTFVIVANAGNKKSSIYNILFLTVFVLVCFNPFIIMEVGFLLSFLAVLGIVYMHPKIYAIFEFNYIVADWLWSVTCMSIAAQIATFPLSLFYFHQFPNYFLLSNLLVIPAALAIMYVGLAFLAFSCIPKVVDYLGWLVEKLVWLLNCVILWVEDLPFSTLNSISLTILQTWSLYAIIFFLILFFAQKRIGWVFALFVAVAIFGISLLVRVYEWKNQHEFIVYQINKHSGIDFINGQKTAFFSDTLLPLDNSKMQFHVFNHRCEMGIKQVNKDLTQEDLGWARLVIWNGIKMLIFDTPAKSPVFKQKLRVDYIVIQHNSVKSLEPIIENFEFKELVIDGSNKKYLAEKLATQARQMGVSFYNTSQEGAFVSL